MPLKNLEIAFIKLASGCLLTSLNLNKEKPEVVTLRDHILKGNYLQTEFH